jgi:hypothetical protein
VLVAWAVAGEPLTWMVVVSSAMVAIGIGAATRR